MFLDEVKTDWLCSKNYFYNVRTKKISDNINELIESDHIRFHPEGLRNYLEYGYSVFGQTPIEEIKMLQANTRISHDIDGDLMIEKMDDPFEVLIGRESNSKDVIDYLGELCNGFLKETDENIIIPTSGGFDSRIINAVLDDKKRLHAFTYGVCEIQENSSEVVYARELCKRLGIDWNFIKIDNFHKKINEWLSNYGPSTHAHGMYQMEFYDQIKRHFYSSGVVISGLFGDIWAGNWSFDKIHDARGLYILSKTHGMNADGNCCKLEETHELRDSYWLQMKEKLKDERWRILEAGRTKITLISYLLRGPEYYGFNTWTPFLDEKLVAMMLNLPEYERKGRKWQVDYFKKRGILIGELNLRCDKSNSLDYWEFKRHPLAPLNPEVLESIIDPLYIENINQKINRMDASDWDRWYGAYLTIYPLQELLKGL